MAKLEQTNYEAVRHLMQSGDMIACSGIGPISDVIRLATNSNITHIGVVYQTWDDLKGVKRVRLIESTSLDGNTGVVTPFMSDRIKSYKGSMYWCPLNDLVREYFDEDAFFKFMFAQEGKGYDIPQAIMSAIDLGIFENKEDLDLLFCSELFIASMKKATNGMLDKIKDLNASWQTPKDCTRKGLCRERYYQLTGEPQRIRKLS